MIGFERCLFFMLNGNQSISLIALLIENLNTWSENFVMNTVSNEPTSKKPVDPKDRVMGSIIRPISMPKRVRIKLVRKNCMINVAIPVYI